MASVIDEDLERGVSGRTQDVRGRGEVREEEISQEREAGLLHHVGTDKISVAHSTDSGEKLHSAA
jgi:hypothetical protein